MTNRNRDRLTNRDTDFVYTRNEGEIVFIYYSDRFPKYKLEIFLCMYMEGRKAEITLVNYLIQVQISVGMLEIQMSVHRVRSMEGDDPDFCGYVSTTCYFISISPSPFL